MKNKDYEFQSCLWCKHTVSSEYAEKNDFPAVCKECTEYRNAGYTNFKKDYIKWKYYRLKWFLDRNNHTIRDMFYGFIIGSVLMFVILY